MFRQAARIALAVLILSTAAASVSADEPAAGSWMQTWLEQQQLTASWWGARDALASWGITPTVRYAADLLAGVAGGQQRGRAYAGQLTFETRADMEKLAGLTGLTFNVAGDWTSGTNLSEEIGNVFSVAQVFAGREALLANLYLQQSLLDGGVDLKLGRFSTGADFLTALDLSLVNAAVNPIVFVVQQNVPSLTDDPNTTWAGRVVARPVAGLSLSAGAFYSDPALDLATANGTEFGISRSAGYLVIGEAAYRLNSEKGDTGLPGRYRVGGYYDSNQYPSLTDPERRHTGNSGVYLLGEQMVYREGGPESNQGLSVFAGVIYAPHERINVLPWFASLGASYRGPLPGRARDTAAFALYYGAFSRHVPDQTYELILEWNYAISLARWLTVQPDVQYVINPGGRSSVGNAVVIGAQIAVEF